MGWLFTPLKLAVGLFGIFWMFIAGVAYVTWLPMGWPNWDLGKAVFPIFHLTIHLPYAGEVQAVKAQAAFDLTQWNQCKTNERQLTSAIASQNAAVAALSAEGSRVKAEAAKAVQRAESALARASEAQRSIAAPIPKTDSICQAAEVVDQRFVGTLK